MSEKKRIRRTGRVTVLATNILILCLIVVFLVMKTRIDTGDQREQERITALNVLAEYSTNVTNAVTNALLAGSAFRGAITLQPNLTQESFSRFAKEIVKGHDALINVATIRDYTIEFVHPYEENADVIGKNLAAIPSQRSTAETALRENKVIFEGPVPLLQGIPGFLLRVPVTTDSADSAEPWGLISIVFSADQLLMDLGRDVVPPPFKIAMRRAGDNTPILGDQSLFETDGLLKTVEIPNGAWTLVILPEGGWTQGTIKASTVITFLFLSVAVLAATNLLFWLRREATVKSDQLRAAIDVLGDGFTLYDAADNLIAYNERYLETYTKSAPIVHHGINFEDILHYGLDRGQYKAGLGREEEWFNERMRAHRHRDYTLEQQLSDGRWLRVREMETPDGGRVGVHVDITEQIESRNRAKIAESRLRDAIDTVPAAFLFFDAEGALEIVNAKALQLFPDAQARMVPGTPIRKLLERLVCLEKPNGTLEDRNARVENLLEQLRQKSSQFDLHVGNDRYYKIVSHRTQEGGVVCFGVDISDLIAQERWLERTNQRLRAVIKERDAAEARFADVADIATEWFWEQGADMCLTYLSPGFEKAIGVSPEKVIGQPRGDLMVGADDPTVQTHLETMVLRKPFDNYIYQSNLRTDKEIWIRSSGKPVFDEDGTFRGYIGTAANVTELYVAMQKAKKADEAKTQFLNMISHELRTPMTVVLGFNAFLRNPQMLPATRSLHDLIIGSDEDALETGYTVMIEEIRTMAEKIDSAGKQLQALIGDVLDLSRIEANTFHIDIAPVNLLDVVQTTISQMQPLAKGKKIALREEVEDATLKCDETRLRQVLINLISNAIKFTDHGTVTIRSKSEGDMMRITVMDTGLGIPKDALNSIFDRFTQADTSSTRNEGGAGLGLAIARDIVALHGGDIAVDKTSRHGTAISFTIPIWAA